jgi:alkylhydroperoxidase family enzyme
MEPKRRPPVTPYLSPVEKPSLMMKMVYLLSRRQVGKVTAPISVFAARMPLAFGNFYGKVSKLDKKLKLPPETAVLIREQVASVNTCLWCMDAARWFAMKGPRESLTRLDALSEYQSSPLFTDAERAALDYAKELTSTKEVDAETFSRVRHHYSEREICDIVWLVASEHLYNVTNIGLGIGSENLCDLSLERAKGASKSSGTGDGLASTASR